MQSILNIPKQHLKSSIFFLALNIAHWISSNQRNTHIWLQLLWLYFDLDSPPANNHTPPPTSIRYLVQRCVTFVDIHFLSDLWPMWMYVTVWIWGGQVWGRVEASAELCYLEFELSQQLVDSKTECIKIFKPQAATS